MTIRFHLTPDDSVAFQRHFMLSDRRNRRNLLVMRWSIPLLVVVLLAVEGIEMKWNMLSVVLYLMIGCAWYFLMPRWTVARILRRARRMFERPENRSSFGKVEMTLTDETILYRHSGIENRYEWARVIKTDETKDYLFIYLSALSACIVPKSQLRSDEIDLLRNFIGSHASTAR